MERKNHYQSSSGQISNVLIGAAAGGLLGIGAALFFTPQGDKIRKKISKTYRDLEDQASDFVDQVIERGEDAVDTTNEYVGKFKSKADELIGEVEKNPNLPLIIGAISGGILGTIAVAAYTSQSAKVYQTKGSNASHCLNGTAKYIRENVQSVDWVNVAREFIDAFGDKVKAGVNDVDDRVERAKRHAIHDILDVAATGFQVWQNLKKRS